MWKTCAIGLAAGMASVSAAAAEPSSICGPRDQILGTLSQRFAEGPAAVGLTKGGELLQVLASADGATWSIVVSRPDGLSCIVAVGQDWQVRKAAARKERIM